MTSSDGRPESNIDQRRLDGRYRLIERLRNGGTAEIWRAHDDRLGRPVAVKILDMTKADSSCVRGEAKALAQFSHPHIASVFDYGDDGGPYLVMEFVAGRALADALKGHDIAWPAAMACCAQVAAALAAAHRRGLVHRDVTPANIMLTPSGAKLIDFGISAIVGQPEADADGNLRGTPAYVAPERLPDRVVTPAADVYSLGLVLYQSLSGHLPWRATSAQELWALRDTIPPDPLPAIEGLPAEVGEICLRCLARDPEDRPDAARLAEVLNALAPAGSGAALAHALDEPTEPTHLLMTRVSTTSAALRPTRTKFLAAVGAASLALGSLGWSLTGWNPAHTTPTLQALSAPAPAVPACAATFDLKSNDGGHFQAAITATQREQGLPDGWQLSLHLPVTQTVDIDPAGGWRREADALTSPAQPALDLGGSARLTLAGRHTGVIPLPTMLHVDGQACDVTVFASAPASTVMAGKDARGEGDRQPSKRHKVNGKG
jgi:eukaryotic-like serine/threonine-protein kinase